ncbi:venom carboxylesterase-6-like [Cimex lectularius]|uniref:Carboxylesterase type B domain-containing protein n=1 Tax=Cimex lectularius TaxID=79782 RepID=A0A8I6TEV3_CIMLE|nr:venom carboxylesterase-6-like [Cimex lectularius]
MRYIAVIALIVCHVAGEIVDTGLGSVRGFERESRAGETYHGFLGVPYAKPPVGKLRFDAPVPPKRWSGVLDATRQPPHCLQNPIYLRAYRNETTGSEDCLYLNIFTPKLKGKLPVMFFIHGGSFRTGYAGPSEMADYLVDEKVVLVAPQYRLGILGFLSTEDKVIPGNFGLKDQAFALKWVVNNIHYFGGDPKKITVFGYGAGGVSANLMMVSPLTNRLIKGAISESGVDNHIWGTDSKKGRAKRMAEKTGRVVGCRKTASKDLLKCLRNADGKELVQSELQNIYWDYETSAMFRPVIEGKSKTAFLTADPAKSSTKKPWVVGVTTGEGNFKIASLVTQSRSVTEEFEEHIDDYIAKILGEEDVTDKTLKSVKKIKRKYFKNTSTVDRLLSSIKNFYGDVKYYWPLQEAVKRHGGKVYQYVYDYRAGQSMSDIFGVDSDLGVNHADETFILFNCTSSGHSSPRAGDKKVSKDVVKMWANFAKTQVPRKEKPKWMPLEADEYLRITEKPRMAKGYRKGVREFWSSLPLYKGDD